MDLVLFVVLFGARYKSLLLVLGLFVVVCSLFSIILCLRIMLCLCVYYFSILLYYIISILFIKAALGLAA